MERLIVHEPSIHRLHFWQIHQKTSKKPNCHVRNDHPFYRKFWDEWNEFEIRHGNEDTFREMRRIKRSVAASFSQLHFNSTTIEAVIPTLPSSSIFLSTHPFTVVIGSDQQVLDSAIAALEKEAAGEKPTELFGKFVKGEVIQSDKAADISTSVTNPEVMDLDDDAEPETEIDIAQKDVPEAVFGGLKRKFTSAASSSSKKRHH